MPVVARRLPNRWWASLLAMVAIVAFFAQVYVHHIKLTYAGGWSYDPAAPASAGNPPGWINTDARAWMNPEAREKIWPLLRLYDAALFANDTVADYYLACYPIGYRGFYTLMSAFDPRGVSRALPYLLLAATAILVGRTVRRLRGPPAGWAALALCLGASIFMARMAGGVPRSFAFPTLALAALALAIGRPHLMALAALLAALFYPPAALVVGVAMAAWLLGMGRDWRGMADDWGWGRRIAVVVVTALLVVAAALPSFLAAREFGAVLRPADAAEYPELGPAGRHAAEDRGDAPFALASLKNFIAAPMAGVGGDWNPQQSGLAISVRQLLALGLLIVGGAGYALLMRRSAAARRVALLPAAGVAGFVVAALATPTLSAPARYQLYPLALAAVVMAPAGIAHLATLLFRGREHRRVQVLAMLATVTPFVVFFSAYRLDGANAGTPIALSDLSRAGLVPVATAEHAADYQALLDELRDPVFDPPPLKSDGGTAEPTRSASLNAAHESRRQEYKRAVFAGFPTDLDGLPYLTGRRVLVTRDNHQATHRLMAEEMRRRTRATLAALFDPTTASLIRLRDEFDVTHLIIDTRLYGPDAPTYFAPFDQDLATLRQRLGGARPAAVSLRLLIQGQVYPPMETTTIPTSDSAPLPRWIILDLQQVR